MGKTFNSGLLIEDNIYGFELKQSLWKQQYDQPENREIIVVILKVISVDLRHFEEKGLRTYLSEDEIPVFEDAVPIQGVKNKEVLARWMDVMLTLNKKNIKGYIVLAHEAYMQVYAVTKDVNYLVRAITLVKYAKIIFKAQFEEIFEEAKKSLFEYTSAFYQQLILIELVHVYGASRCQNEFMEFLEDKIKHFISVKDFRSARFCIRSLQLIGTLNKNQCNIRMAENYETEGDLQVSEMQPNTFYPTISGVYLKGFKLIASAGDCPELHYRLERKVAALQLEVFRTLQAGGIRMIPEIDLDAIHKNVLKMNLRSSSLAYHTLLDISLIPSSAVEQMAQRDKKQGEMGLGRFFSEQVKISGKGAQVAAQELTDSHKSNARTYMREKLMAYIYFIKNALDGYMEMDKAMVMRLLVDAKSPFVPVDRMHDYCLGLTAGFKNDFITAAHLLIPQLENSLRHLAVTNDIIVTTYDKRFHHENLLGGLFTKIRSLGNEDIFDELESFLVDNNNVNFRNELLHGLMETSLVYKYGQYVWWLCLKMILQTRLIFPEIKQ